MIVFDAGQDVIDWLATRAEAKWPDDPKRACAEYVGDRITGAWAYFWHRGHDIHLAVACEGHFFSRSALYWCYAIPFLQYGVRRMTAIISEQNARSRKLAEHAGFREEGRIRSGMKDGKDAIIYGMLRDECRFIT